VTTLSHRDLSMVISNSPMTKYVVSQEHLLAHERVVEEVMREFTPLPVRFCTIASSVDEVRNLLDRRYREFKNLLKDMDHKVELGVKGFWKNMVPIYNEIVKENQTIERLREKARPRSGKKRALLLETRVEMGKLVEEALQRKKDEEGEMIWEAVMLAWTHKDIIGAIFAFFKIIINRKPKFPVRNFIITNIYRLKLFFSKVLYSSFLFLRKYFEKYVSLYLTPIFAVSANAIESSAAITNTNIIITSKLRVLGHSS